MNNTVVQLLEFIFNDIKRNYNAYHETNLIKAISQFQINVLESHKKDDEIDLFLNKLSVNEISKYIQEMNLNILSPPKTKAKLVSLINALIMQSGTKSLFLERIKSNISLKVSQITRKKKPPIIVDIAQYKDLRKTWMTSENLIDLETKLNDMKMNEIRAIVVPWKLKGRSKKDLIDSISQYIKRMRGLSKLGT